MTLYNIIYNNKPKDSPLRGTSDIDHTHIHSNINKHTQTSFERKKPISSHFRLHYKLVLILILVDFFPECC